jgi:catechol 2,3-dioxygenase-like lactoylglutathione lyase family enzyme
VSVTGFWHGGITVADTERSHAFYVGQLGLRVYADRIVDDPALLRVVATEAAALRVSMLEIPGADCYVELVEYLGVDAAAPAVAPESTGVGHLCFYVDDLRALWDRLCGAGVEAVSDGPIDCSSRIPDTWCMYVRDPDGHLVELFEGPRYPQGRRSPAG